MKLKRIVLSLALVLIVGVSCLAFVGCGSNVDKKDLYGQVEKVVTTIADENDGQGMFVSRSVNGLQTDYALNYYVNRVDQYYYNEIFVLPMNYILKYYKDLERLNENVDVSGEGQQAINQVSQDVSKMIKTYQDCVEHFNTYQNLDNTHQKILEGTLTIYRESLQDLIGQVYGVANGIAQIKDLVFDDFNSLKNTNTVLQTKDTETLRDYIVLQLATDYYKQLVVNLDMNDYSGKAGNTSVQVFAGYNAQLKSGLTKLYQVQTIPAERLADLTGDANVEEVTGQTISYDNKPVQDLLQTNDGVVAERQLFEKATEFSLMKFYEDYSCNLDAYQNNLPYAKAYYNEQVLYFADHINDYVDYLLQTLTIGD